MNKYNTFLIVFIISVVSLIFFLVFYMSGIFSVVLEAQKNNNPDPFEILATLFSPKVIIAMLVLGISSLLYRILGIVHVARNKIVTDGEKALWIIGFIIMGFLTGIVFLIMAKERKFVE